MGSSKDLLFLNVYPELLVAVNSHGKIFERVLHNHSLPTDKVVIEINESAVSQDNFLNDAIVNYRERGYKIAMSTLNRNVRFSCFFFATS
ncbi:hypothetical protein W01_01810 [Candidatus Nitrotoga sp. AM1P]|nr:hypothetical protein W01_01810 [Candidatus Nitrotoga sp. AM1P]